ncbi:MAG: hypothetical protein M1828_003455 [Chrysothrix sp. TS-e1954]|nr:MAG: hypothetical protein M1828_003455 [Chrysothrix sp. TS-e1954]
MSSTLKAKIQAQRDTKIDLALRGAVVQAFNRGEQNDLSTNKAREAARLDLTTRSDPAQRLELEENFFKSNDRWKVKSKQVIEDECEAQFKILEKVEARARRDGANPERGTVINGANGASQSKTTINASATLTKSVKRKEGQSVTQPSKECKGGLDGETAPLVGQKARPGKRVAVSSPSEPESEESAPKTKRRKKVEDQSSESSHTESESEAGEPTQLAKAKSTEPAKELNDSSSELSVLDESIPPPKRKRPKLSEPGAASKKITSKPGRQSKSSPQSQTPDDEEVKRLQKQLVQCGVRKIWGKELKPFETPKARIKHLKGLLNSVGMTGRFSAEKAKQIKEQRELQADLEEIKERDKTWGMGDQTSNDGVTKPRKRVVAKGLQQLAIFDDEESD